MRRADLSRKASLPPWQYPHYNCLTASLQVMLYFMHSNIWSGCNQYFYNNLSNGSVKGQTCRESSAKSAVSLSFMALLAFWPQVYSLVHSHHSLCIICGHRQLSLVKSRKKHCTQPTWQPDSETTSLYFSVTSWRWSTLCDKWAEELHLVSQKEISVIFFIGSLPVSLTESTSSRPSSNCSCLMETDFGVSLFPSFFSTHSWDCDKTFK